MSSSGKSKAATPKLKKASVVIIRTEWNAAIVDELFAGCKKILQSGKVDWQEYQVPGAIEIPFAIKNYWNKTGKKKPDAFIALGCVIKGDTPHFEYVCRSVTDGITALNLQLPVPVIFGILTVNTEEQAKERIGGIHGHKGEEAADAALKMISFSRSL
ncbi:MAG TPA: 6,7-dimethyl-8-ribityllumazine synthase [Puia sp.]|nr:6,7-dimethyl-8-ribityllumazine synthase [Puia sp.]